MVDQPSPLAEASTDSLAELFSRDPLGLSDQDLDRIVAALREQRERWNLAESKGAKRAPKQPAPASLDLNNLGLKL